jgi:hypothetical protein
MIRGGTSRSVLSREDRLFERNAIEVRSGSLWLAFDAERSAGEGGLNAFTQPLALDPPGETLALFGLPNGLPAFAVFGGDRTREEESSLLFDTLQNDFVLRSAISCMGCHASGPFPFAEEVRPFVEENRFEFTADEFEAVQDLYPSATELDSIIEGDTERYRLALARAGVASDRSDPISDVVHSFGGDVDLSRAAADLMVPADVLRDSLPQLGAELSRLATGSVSREVFADAYVGSLCVSLAFSENRPAESACSAALDN